MAVQLHDGFLLQRCEFRGVEIGLAREKFPEQKNLAAQLSRILIFRKKVHKLIAKHGRAARLETDDRCSRLDLRPQRAE